MATERFQFTILYIFTHIIKKKAVSHTTPLKNKEGCSQQALQTVATKRFQFFKNLGRNAYSHAQMQRPKQDFDVAEEGT